MHKTIAIFTATRSEYGLLSPVISAIRNHSELDYQLIITGSHLDYYYGNTVSEIEEDGFNISCQFSLPAVFGINKINAYMSTVFSELNKALQLLEPDIMLVIGDRFETFAAAQSALFRNIPVAHIHGGDITQGGALDDLIRHALTKLAHIHFPVCEDSAERIRKLGEEPWRICMCGSPGIDNCKRLSSVDPQYIAKKFNLDLNLPVVLFTQHSVTTEFNEADIQTEHSLESLKDLGYQTIISYPNLDPGGEKIIDLLTDYKITPNFQIHENLGYKNYLGLMKVCSVVVGNTSSGILETPYFKKPFVNIGTRQKGRQLSTNVINVGYNKYEISEAIEKAIHDKDFYRQNVENCINPYGDGHAGEKIALYLSEIELSKTLLQKQITF